MANPSRVWNRIRIPGIIILDPNLPKSFGSEKLPEKQCFGFGSGLDPGFNEVPRSRSRRAKMAQKNRKQLINLIFLSERCSLLRAESFSCRLDVLYGGLGIIKLFIFFKNGKENF
jgi:hypothetical protein